MSMRAMEELRDKLCKELDEVTDDGKLDHRIVEYIDKLTHSIKSIDTIIAMHDYEDDYSGARGRMDGGRTYGGNSYARGRGRNARRDSMGRYSRDDGYSYDGAKEDIIEEVKEIMMDAPDEATKKKFKRFVSELENM